MNIITKTIHDVYFSATEDMLNNMLNSTYKVTTDFDDTLWEKTDRFNSRLRLFSLISWHTDFYIVTKREHYLFESEKEHKLSDNIFEYCAFHNFRIRGVYHNVIDKAKLLHVLNPICHFEDNVDTIRDCVKYNIPVMCPGEILSTEYYTHWIQTLKENNEHSFYHQDILDTRKKITM